jgi:hypothetical protein
MTINPTWLKIRLCEKLSLPFSIQNTVEVCVEGDVINVILDRESDYNAIMRQQTELNEFRKEVKMTILCSVRSKVLQKTT